MSFHVFRPMRKFYLGDGASLLLTVIVNTTINVVLAYLGGCHSSTVMSSPLSSIIGVKIEM